jgi:plastocyanin
MRKLVIALAAFAIAVMTSVSVGANNNEGGGSNRVISRGQEKFVPNEVFRSAYRFDPGWIRVHSGDTVNWVNRTEAPHTITIVTDTPDDPPELFFCREPGGECRAALDAHFATTPPTAVINVGAAGLDAPGDSLFQPPGGSVSGVISAPADTTLLYICAIHPWMQGRIRVA